MNGWNMSLHRMVMRGILDQTPSRSRKNQVAAENLSLAWELLVEQVGIERARNTLTRCCARSGFRPSLIANLEKSISAS